MSANSDHHSSSLSSTWNSFGTAAQPITDPFLGLIRDVFWHNSPLTVPEAVFAATWTLEHAIKVNPGGVKGPIKMAVLEGADKAQLRASVLDDPELEEHPQDFEAAKDALRRHRESQQPVSESGAPDVPKP